MARVKKSVPPSMRRTTGEKIYNVFNIFVLSMFTLICVYPFYYLIINSFSDNNAAAAGEVMWWFKGFHLQNYKDVLGLNGELGGNVEIEYALGYDAKQINQDESWQEESLENSKGSDAKDVNRARELRDEAVAKARAYAAAGDPVVFIGGLDHEHDLEGRDRTDMRLPYGQDELIEALLDANPTRGCAWTSSTAVWNCSPAMWSTGRSSSNRTA